MALGFRHPYMARNLPTFGQRRHSSLPSLIHAECEVTMQEEQACSIYSFGDQTDTLDHGQRPEYAFDRKLISSTTSCKYVTVLFIERGLCLSPLELLYFSRIITIFLSYTWWRPWLYALVMEHTHAAAAWPWRLCVDQILLSQPDLSLLENFVSGDPSAAS